MGHSNILGFFNFQSNEVLSNKIFCGIKIELFSFGEIPGGVISGGSQGSQESCSTPIRKAGNMNYTSFEAPGLQT